MIPNAKTFHCGWYIVHQGFGRYVDTTFPDISRTVVHNHKKIIQNWMFSLMKRCCITYFRYRYSRYVFMKHLFSPQVTNTFGLAFSNNVAIFVQRHVLLHEKYFIYSQRNGIQHYGEYSNTPLDGTNFSLHHSSISTHHRLSKLLFFKNLTEYFNSG